MVTDRWKEVAGNAKELAKVASEQPGNSLSVYRLVSWVSAPDRNFHELNLGKKRE